MTITCCSVRAPVIATRAHKGTLRRTRKCGVCRRVWHTLEIDEKDHSPIELIKVQTKHEKMILEIQAVMRRFR